MLLTVLIALGQATSYSVTSNPGIPYLTMDEESEIHFKKKKKKTRFFQFKMLIEMGCVKMIMVW